MAKTNPTEVYGFVLWISSAVAYIIFLAWAFTPEEVLHSVGITYYPSKYVSCVAWPHRCLDGGQLPSRRTCSFCSCLCSSLMARTICTAPILSAHFPPSPVSPSAGQLPHCNADSFARQIDPAEKHTMSSRRIGSSAADAPFAIPEISDIPIDVVNKLLYQPRSRGKNTVAKLNR